MRTLCALSCVLLLVLSASTLPLDASARLQSERAPMGQDQADSPATNTTGWFPFTLPWDDASATPVDASDLLLDAPGQDPATVIDTRGFVETGPDGHFHFANTGARARFWGTNLTFSGVFPPSPAYPPGSGEFQDQDASGELAGRLAKLGFNAVRLHHLDWGSRPSGIWQDNTANTRVMDPVQLGRLDYLIYQLKRHGIYVDLNLHVSRTFTSGDGVTDAPEFAASGVAFGKGATLFDPVMIALEQKYAGQLLSHVNPYTGLAYKDDPVILTTETTNEDSFFLAWSGDQLNHRLGDASSFPAFSSQELDGWTHVAGTGPAINRLRNPGFDESLTDWSTRVGDTAQATFTVDPGAHEGSPALKVEVTQVGDTSWEVQVIQAHLALQAGKTYRIRFAARAPGVSQPTTIAAEVMRDSPPWDSLGCCGEISLDTSWQTYTFEFTATETITGDARVCLDVGQAALILEFDDFLFQETDAFRGWNGWLEDRYGSTAAVQAAWAPAGGTVPETEMLTNGSFEDGREPWGAQVGKPAVATFSIDASTATAGTRSFKAEVTVVDGDGWHVQLNQGGFGVTAGQTYRLSFDAKASAAGGFNAWVTQNHDPWQGLGLGAMVEPAASWQSFQFFFTATASEANAHVAFDLGQSVRALWIDNVSLKPFNPAGLLPGESLEANNVARLRRSEGAAYTPQRLRDTLRFYDETQAAFFSGMRETIQTAQGSHSLNTGTASFIDSLADIHAMAQLDFVDNHRYWDHPYWVGVPGWSPTGWFISNQAWVNAPFANLFGLATTAVQGKPFTVTEFNEVFPNRYAAEGPLLLATFANLQDWDALFQFAYTGDQLSYNADHVQGFFDLAGNPLATGLMPVAARLFLAQQTTPAPTVSLLSYTQNERYDSAPSGWGGSIADYLRVVKGVDPAAAFGSRLRIADFDAPAPVTPDLPTPAGPVYTSAGGQLRWDVTDPARGLVTFDAPHAQGAVGFLAGRSVALANLALDMPADTTRFAAIVAQSRDGRPLAVSGQVLLSVFTRVENTGQVWNADQTSLDDRWGGPPALIEPLSATVTLTVSDPAAVSVWALDETGAWETPVNATVIAPDQLRFTVDTGVQQTLWYGLLRLHKTYLPLCLATHG
jgi:hypothetical protein